MDNIVEMNARIEFPKELLREVMLDIKGNAYYFTSESKALIDYVIEIGGITNFSLVRACEAVNKVYGNHRRVETISKWMSRFPIKQLILEAMKRDALVKGFDKREWEYLGITRMRGENQMTNLEAFYWREFGKMRGWYTESPMNVQNMQIKITQADGNE